MQRRKKFVLSSSLRIPEPSLLGDPQTPYQPTQEMTLSLLIIMYALGYICYISMKFSPKNSNLGPNLKWHFNKLCLTISAFVLSAKKKKKTKNLSSGQKAQVQSCTYGQLIYKKGGKYIQWRIQEYTIKSLQQWYWENWIDKFKRMKLEHF